MASGRVVGSVRDTSGAIVVDAQISATTLGAPDGAPVEARTDRDGAFALDLTWPGGAPTQVYLDVRAPGCAALAWPALSDPRAGGVEPGTTLALDLVLAPGFGLRLLVEDANGQSVAGAEAEVILNNTVAHACSWPSSPWGRRSRPLTTDVEGRVEILGLVDLPYGERYFVSIRHPERAEAWIDHAEALPREAGWASTRVVLSPGHEMRGTIRGAPEGAAVLAALRDVAVPGCHGVVRRAITDAAGQFVLTGLREGEHTVQVSGPGVLPTTTALHVPASAPIALEVPAGRVLTVRVRGKGAQAVVGAVATAEWSGGYVEGPAGATGTVALVLPCASRVEVCVRPEGGRGLLGFAVIDPGAVAVDLDIDVSACVPWTARVVDDTTGADTVGDCSVAVRPVGADATFHF
ncbi:MAG: carboxypeptidase regulatory-like domain-containing protein, partial [Polyangiaceae bacterium]|nr:carboxypeptidase regulatory-like domain-containing protein [Polyangiaceae bacterium]